MNNTAPTQEFRCVLELCPPTPGYNGFSPGAIKSTIAILNRDPSTRRAYRYTRKRKMVFGFPDPTSREQFLWAMRDQLMNLNFVHERAHYTETDIAA